MGEGIATKPQLRRRRILQRPRLTTLLDESQGRIKMLVAPAGYGKTTLARQWLGDRTAVWYAGTAASVDVAALAAGLCSAISNVVQGAGDTLVGRLLAASLPDEEPDVLARMLASDLVDWPADAWLVFDDYHAIAGTATAERFVETLLLEASLNVLFMTRLRPCWASSRRILYGEIFELDRTQLAMTDSEAMELLTEQERGVTELISVAQGWPAVLALASMSTVPLPAVTATSYLYGFFADEIYKRLDPRVAEILSELALYETSGRKFALDELPSEEVEEVIRAGVASGFLTASDNRQLDMHPLLRTFLEQKLRDERPGSTADVVAQATRTMIRHELWDEAFDLIERSGEHSLVPGLLWTSMEHMLTLGRVATLRKWVKSAQQDAPEALLVSSELAFREGRFHESEGLATLAARHGVHSGLVTCALLAAGRAAHAASREAPALSLYSQAAKVAPSEDLKRRAALGELSAAIELEKPEAVELLSALGSPESMEPDERVILVSRMINLETRFGLPVSLEEGRAMWQLLSHVRDPVARSSFRNVFGYTLAAMGHGDEALLLMAEQLDEADRFQLDFVVPYALVNKALVQTGARNYVGAEELLDEADARARRSGDQTAFHIAWAIRTRLYNAQGAFDLALSRALPKASATTVSLEAEVIASYSLALAGLGEVARAREHAHRAQRMSSAVEIAITAPCALAVTANREGHRSEALTRARRALESTTKSGMVESFVSAYRGCPEIVVFLLEDLTAHDDLVRVLTIAGDTSVASERGFADRSILTLSPREKEVLALLSQGMSNPEIGDRLFISPVTVKVHVRHIFEKLGVRSRAEAALRSVQLSRVSGNAGDG